ncbi:hypothetical protein B0H11DRAFT_2327458 [Mycena galericulata]|nr:hypothetical protein B0H11DRAFT_2327458 [Mycena galericulata]
MSFLEYSNNKHASFHSANAIPQCPSGAHPEAPRSTPTEPREDLSSDLELSFALYSPPRKTAALTPESEYPKPMDISPALGAPPVKPHMRPRAFTSGSSMFGSDRSNESIHSCPPPSLQSDSTHSSGKLTQGSALPLQLFSASVRTSDEPDGRIFSEASYSPEDAMDVDTSFEVPALYLVAPQSAAPTLTRFNTLSYDIMSPPARRSLSPERVTPQEHDHSSSPSLSSSPSQNKLDRIVTGLLFPLEKHGVEGLARRYLSALAQTSLPIIEREPIIPPSPPEHALPPARRVFSAAISGSHFGGQLAEQQSSDESSFEGMSSPAQQVYEKRQVNIIGRCDATDFRPLTGASPSAKFLSAGIPGFSDNESGGKLLPCHRVPDDGLMRIQPETLNKLLDGHYSERAHYHIIDCRFDYEFNGGHINGAVNLNKTSDVEDFFLRSSLKKPKPSVSGDPARKIILVFHCEFSAKRAPTFAKHLRAKDRALNNHVYPKIHYPELYILEGGYCRYFQTSSSRCLPHGYVTMDDPVHTVSRDRGLNQMRKTKFSRHKSYTYGDGASNVTVQQHRKHNTVPTGPGSIFAAARTRRSGPLPTLAEDGNVTEDTDEGLGDSPCPLPPKANKKASRALPR